MSECVLDTVRFFDEASREWGYAVACVGEHSCGYWRELIAGLLADHIERATES